MLAKQKRESVDGGKKLYAQYSEECERHPEAGDSLRVEFEKQSSDRHCALEAKHEAEQEATALLLTAVTLSRQQDAERMVAYER